jgi:hypothetical protein
VPAQFQFHGPMPATAEAVPVVHRLVVGLLLRLSPFDDPHAPLTVTGLRDAVHCAVLPPLLPAQLQFHGPVPLTVDVVPAVQRLVVGLLLRLWPFDDPHAPLTSRLRPPPIDAIEPELPGTVPVPLDELATPPELEPELLPVPGLPACCCSICCMSACNCCVSMAMSCWICVSRFCSGDAELPAAEGVPVVAAISPWRQGVRWQRDLYGDENDGSEEGPRE